MSKFILPSVFLGGVTVLIGLTIGVAVGLAYALNWLVPAFDLTTSMFIVLATLMFWGLIAFGFAMATVALSNSKIDALDHGSDDEASEDPELQAEMVANRVFELLSDRLERGARQRRTRY